MLLCPFLIRPGTAFPAVSDLALPHNPQELILPGLNRPYSTDQNYKKPVHSPPQSKGKAWREEMLPVVFLQWFFSHFPVTQSKLHRYLQGQNAVLRSWSSDLDKWHSIYEVLSLEGITPSTIFPHSVFVFLQAKSARTYYFQFCFFPSSSSLFYFILFCVLSQPPFSEVSPWGNSCPLYFLLCAHNRTLSA